MPADRRAAAWARLQTAVGEEDDEPPVRARRGDRRRDLLWGAVLVAAAAVVLIVGTRGRTPRQADGDAHSQAAHGAAGSTDALTATTHPHGGNQAEPRESSPPPAVPEAAPEPPTRAPAARAADVPKDMPALDAELALLRAAREALGRKAPAAALVSLDQHAREFPGGHLVEERMLLRAQAQCELGRREAARAAAAELVRAFPESPHARTVAGLCAD